MTTLTTNIVTISSAFRHGFEVELNLTLNDIIDQLKVGEILDSIGKSRCIDHFNIEEASDE